MNICIYGAASNSIDKIHIEAGEQLGRALAKQGCSLVFGGCANGMMGAVARGAAEYGAKIIGVAPSFFNVDGVLFEECTMHYTKTMRERKALIEELSDGFIACPGGIGTMDEFFEIVTLRSLNQHNKPIVLLNTGGFYNKLLEMLDEFDRAGIMRGNINTLVYVTDNPQDAASYFTKEMAKCE